MIRPEGWYWVVVKIWGRDPVVGHWSGSPGSDEPSGWWFSGRDDFWPEHAVRVISDRLESPAIMEHPIAHDR